ncbi:hypothetical protein MMPV_000011 [Pyropia vietnamensis]
MAIGAWGDAGDTLMIAAPLVALVGVTLGIPRVPATVTLPATAAAAAVIRAAYLGSPAVVLAAAIVGGALEAFTPLSIVAGAMTLFAVMDVTGCLSWATASLAGVTGGHPVAEAMLIGWSFGHVVEGASGFGTPVALAAPVLVTLGHEPVAAIAACLLFNTLATVYGAAGTPLSYGFDGLSLSDADRIAIGLRSAVLLTAAATVVPPIAVCILVGPRVAARSGLFVVAAVVSFVGPLVGLAAMSIEFPALLGGLISVAITSGLAWARIGLHDEPPHTMEDPHMPPPPRTEDERGRAHPGCGLGQLLGRCRRRGRESGSRQATSGTAPPGTPTASVPIDEETGQVPGTVEGDSGTSDSSNTSPPTVSPGTEDVAVDEGAAIGSIADLSPRKVPHSETSAEAQQVPPRFVEPAWLVLLSRTFPIWGSVALLALTRVQAVGLGDLLRRTDPHFSIDLRTIGTLRVSAAAVISLSDIMGSTERWAYATLYIPALCPFFLVSAASLAYWSIRTRNPFWATAHRVGRGVASRLVAPAVALTGALILVALLRNDDGDAPGSAPSPAFTLGDTLGRTLGAGWLAVAVAVGSIGSFFSGSTTVSNLTFGPVAVAAAGRLPAVSVRSALALQAVGASAGNAVCLANILNAKAVVGAVSPTVRGVSEATFVRRTVAGWAAFWAVATAAGSALFLTVWK